MAYRMRRATNLGQQLLQRLGVPQPTIARAIGVTQSTVSGWALGKFLPEDDHRGALFQHYKIPACFWDEAPTGRENLPKQWPPPVDHPQRVDRRRRRHYPVIAALVGGVPSSRRSSFLAMVAPQAPVPLANAAIPTLEPSTSRSHAAGACHVDVPPPTVRTGGAPSTGALDE